MNTHCLLLRKDLSGPLATPQWPSGVSLVPLRNDLLQPIHALLSQGYADGDGSVGSWDEWCKSLLHDAEFDPQLCFVAMRSEEVVRMAQGWTSAYLKDLVVHVRYQGQGIGQALLTHVFAVYQQRGEPWADLKVNENNTTARRLYARAGMYQIQRIKL